MSVSLSVSLSLPVSLSVLVSAFLAFAFPLSLAVFGDALQPSRASP
jgi:hypothetical protein